jgi:hypothetical protein
MSGATLHANMPVSSVVSAHTAALTLPLPAAAPTARRRRSNFTEADEEEDECRIGDEHECDGADVAPGFADSEHRVARQDTEA